MSHGAVERNGKMVRFGWSDVEDWFLSVILSFPAPWSVADLNGKYYGTEIRDARSVTIMSVWESEGDPSAREKGDMTDEEWTEYCCDSHWESELALRVATAIVDVRNHLAGDGAAGRLRAEEAEKGLVRAVLQYCRWDEAVEAEIRCGGPERRLTNAEVKRRG